MSRQTIQTRVFKNRAKSMEASGHNLVCDVAAAERRWGTLRIIELDHTSDRSSGIMWMRFGCDICGAETAKLYVKLFTTAAPTLPCPNCQPEAVNGEQASPGPSCGKCGVTGVKIYREYGSFRQPESDRCNECIDQGSKGWMIPCVLDAEGNAWGYTSVPEGACDEFYALPEKSSEHPHWRRTGGWSDSDYPV